MTEHAIRSMQAFIAIADSGSMAAAARLLELSNSAISQHIQKLEQQLNISLLHRNTRQLTLTEAGQVYYDCCKLTVSNWHETKQRLSTIRDDAQGELRIAAPVGFAACGLLSAPINQLLDKHPQLRIRLFVQDTDFDLIANRIDLALSVNLGPLVETSLQATKLAEWDMVLAASPDYLAKSPLQGRLPLHPSDLTHLRWLHHENIKNNHLLLQHAGAVHHITPNEKLRLNNMQALIQFTRDGLGMAMLPKPEIMQELKHGTLQQLLPNWQLPTLFIYAVSPTRQTQPVKVANAIKILTQALHHYQVA